MVFKSRFSVALLNSLAEIHFSREKAKHTNAPNEVFPDFNVLYNGCPLLIGGAPVNKKMEVQFQRSLPTDSETLSIEAAKYGYG